MRAGHVDLARERRQAVPVTAVDPLVGCPERGNRLPALVSGIELGAHHRREDPLTTVRRVDTDDGDARARDRTSGNRQVEGERSGAADRALAVERGVHVVERMHAEEALGDVVVDLPAAVFGDGPDCLLELRKRLARANLDRH